MCGIFGFQLKRPLTKDDIALGHRGMRMLRHRGPDAADCWVDERAGVFLGHTRLAIIDTSAASNQPMQRGGTVLVYNGELYNYKDIRFELQQLGVTFTTGGDTEVLLRAWQQWGSTALDKFDGMFAFVVYENQRLVITCDSFGEKPLYWVDHNDGFYFSSEPQPLVQLLKLSCDISASMQVSFLAFGYIPFPHTAFRSLRKISPATIMEVAQGCVQSQRTYWKMSEPRAIEGRVSSLSDKQLDRIHGCLIASVKSRLVSDVPIGLFLSSGTDSSLIAAIVKKELHQDLQALTVRFAGTLAYDESREASVIAHHLGIPHRILSSEDDKVPSARNLYSLIGDLCDDVSAFGYQQMAHYARPHETVALSGLGADEMFYGYGRYQRFYRLRSLHAMQPRLRQAIVRLLSMVPIERSKKMRNLISSFEQFPYLGNNYPHIYHWLQQMVGSNQLQNERMFGSVSCRTVAEMRQFDFTHTLPSSYIVAGERATMRESVELRTPYLNRTLYELIGMMDYRAFVAFGQKSVMKRLLARYFPSRMFDKPKRGFSFPCHSVRELQSESAPALPSLPLPWIQHVWQRRKQKEWSRLALRIALLTGIHN